MNQFMRTPSFTASHPDMGNRTANSVAANIDHGRSDGGGPAIPSAPSHTAANSQVARPTLHLPAIKQGVARRNWPFLDIPSH